MRLLRRCGSRVDFLDACLRRKSRSVERFTHCSGGHADKSVRRAQEAKRIACRLFAGEFSKIYYLGSTNKIRMDFSAALLSPLGLESLTNKSCNNSYNTINFSTNIICFEIAVDKLSNIRKSNFLIFLVDKTYTLVVYLSTR